MRTEEIRVRFGTLKTVTPPANDQAPFFSLPSPLLRARDDLNIVYIMYEM